MIIIFIEEKEKQSKNKEIQNYLLKNVDFVNQRKILLQEKLLMRIEELFHVH